MDRLPDHALLDAALKRCGASWDASQAHGLLSGRLATAGADGGFDWLAQVLEGTRESDALRAECERMLGELFEETYRQLSARQSEFEPLLPDDAETTGARATALAHWCEGFLHGLVSARHAEAVKERLAAEPLAEIIKDLLEITRATADEDANAGTDDEAYTEIVEYLRVAAQLAYEELAVIRDAGDEGTTGVDALH